MLFNGDKQPLKPFLVNSWLSINIFMSSVGLRSIIPDKASMILLRDLTRRKEERIFYIQKRQTSMLVEAFAPPKSEQVLPY
jgi:hypothetical protein